MSTGFPLTRRLGSLLRREEAEIYVRRRIATETVVTSAGRIDRTGHIESLGIRLITAENRLGTAWAVGFDPGTTLQATLQLARECAFETGSLPYPDNTSPAGSNSWLPIEDAQELIISYAQRDLGQAIDAGLATTGSRGLVSRAWIDQEHIFSTLGIDASQQTITLRVDGYAHPAPSDGRVQPGIAVHLVSWDPHIPVIGALTEILARLTPQANGRPPAAAVTGPLFIAPPAVALISKLLSNNIVQNRLPAVQDSTSTWSLDDHAERTTIDGGPAFDGEGYILRNTTILSHGMATRRRFAADAQGEGVTPSASTSRSDSDALPHLTIHRPYLNCRPGDSHPAQPVWIPDEQGSVILQIPAPTCHIDRQTGALYGEAIFGYITDGVVGLVAERPFRLSLPDYLNAATSVGLPWGISSGGPVLAQLLRGSPEHLVHG